MVKLPFDDKKETPNRRLSASAKRIHKISKTILPPQQSNILLFVRIVRAIGTYESDNGLNDTRGMFLITLCGKRDAVRNIIETNQTIMELT